MKSTITTEEIVELIAELAREAFKDGNNKYHDDGVIDLENIHISAEAKHLNNHWYRWANGIKKDPHGKFTSLGGMFARLGKIAAKDRYEESRHGHELSEGKEDEIQSR